MLAAITVSGADGVARAGMITVWSCHRPDGHVAPLDRWNSAINAAGITNTNTCTDNAAGTFGTIVSQTSHPGHTIGTWTYTAPANTTLTGFAYTRDAFRTGWADTNLFVGPTAIWDSVHMAEACGAVGPCLGLAHARVAIGGLNTSGMQLLTESCAVDAGCDGSSYGWLNVYSTEVQLEDDETPTFWGLSGQLATATTVSGTATATLNAQDDGTGVYRLRTSIDGSVVSDAAISTNNGRCVPIAGARDFTYSVPCALRAPTSTSIDTTRLSEGQHQVKVVVEDASGNVSTVLDRPLTVDNVALPSGGVPAIGGTLENGQTLTARPGDWTGAVSFQYLWQRCAANGDGCTQIPAVGGPTYTLSAADVGSSIEVRVIARNSANEYVASTSRPSAVVTEARAPASGRSGDDGHPPADTTPPGGQQQQPAPGGQQQQQPPGGGQAAPSVTPATGNGPVAQASNGTNAGVRAVLRAGFRGARRMLLVRAGAGAVAVSGRLVNAQNGGPIAGASIEVGARANATGAVEHVRSLRTASDGTFVFRLARNAAGQTLTLRYRASAGAAVTASATLHLRVRATISWSATSSHRVLHFAGRLPSPAPTRPRQYIEVQWRRGSAWATLSHPVVVGRDGRWRLTYRVGSNVATGERFRFRAAIRSTSAAYPYEAAASAPRVVRVR